MKQQDNDKSDKMISLGEAIEWTRLGILPRMTEKEWRASKDSQRRIQMGIASRVADKAKDRSLAHVEALVQLSMDRLTMLKELGAPPEDLAAESEILEGLEYDKKAIAELIGQPED